MCKDVIAIPWRQTADRRVGGATRASRGVRDHGEEPELAYELLRQVRGRPRLLTRRIAAGSHCSPVALFASGEATATCPEVLSWTACITSTKGTCRLRGDAGSGIRKDRRQGFAMRRGDSGTAGARSSGYERSCDGWPPWVWEWNLHLRVSTSCPGKSRIHRGRTSRKVTRSHWNPSQPGYHAQTAPCLPPRLVHLSTSRRTRQYIAQCVSKWHVQALRPSPDRGKRQQPGIDERHHGQRPWRRCAEPGPRQGCRVWSLPSRSARHSRMFVFPDPLAPNRASPSLHGSQTSERFLYSAAVVPRRARPAGRPRRFDAGRCPPQPLSTFR